MLRNTCEMMLSVNELLYIICRSNHNLALTYTQSRHNYIIMCTYHHKHLVSQWMLIMINVASYTTKVTNEQFVQMKLNAVRRVTMVTWVERESFALI